MKRIIWIIAAFFFIVAGLLYSQTASAGALIKLIVLLVGLLFLFFVASFFRGETLFYIYLSSLFYADYLKLAMPSLPLGFLPDGLLFLFLIRMVFYERHRIVSALTDRRFLVPNLVAGGYFLFNLLQMFNPALPSVLLGLQTLRALFKIMMAYWGVLWVIDSRQKLVFLVKLVAFHVTVVFFYAFKQILFGFWGFELKVYNPGDIRRIYSLTTNAALFSLILGIGMVKWYLDSVLKGKFFYTLCLIVFFVVSAMSLHRAPLVASVAAILMVAVLNARQVGRFVLANLHKAGFIVFAGIISAGFILVTPLPPRYAEVRRTVLDRFLETREGLNEDSLNVRVKQVAPAVDAVRTHPFGGGLGYTQLRFKDKLDDLSFFKGLFRVNYKVNMPMGTGDNTFLTVALETGWVGMLVFTFVLFYGIITSIGRLCDPGLDPDSRYYVSFALGIMTIVTLSVLTSSIYFIVTAGTMYWLGMGIAQASMRTRTA